MFNFFNKLTPLDDVLKLIKNDNNPKIIFCDYNVLINKNNFLNETTSMFPNSFKNFLNNEKLLEFLIFSKSNTPKEMEDNFIVNDLIDSIYNQGIFNINFFKENRKLIDRINNIIYINNIEQNDFLYNLCLDDFYNKPYNKPLHIYVIFSSVLDVIDFTLRFKIPNHLHIILYNTTFNYLSENENKIFEFINNILNIK